MHTPLLDGIRKEAGIPWHVLGSTQPWILPVAGAAIGGGAGALIDSENRLRGGLIGAGVGGAMGLGGQQLLGRTLGGQKMQLKALTGQEVKKYMKANNLTKDQAKTLLGNINKEMGGGLDRNFVGLRPRQAADSLSKTPYKDFKESLPLVRKNLVNTIQYFL